MPTSLWARSPGNRRPLYGLRVCQVTLGAASCPRDPVPVGLEVEGTDKAASSIAESPCSELSAGGNGAGKQEIWDAWVAQSIKRLPWAQVVISGS